MLDEEEEEQEEDDEDWNDGGDEEDSDEEEGDDVETVMMLSDEGGVISLLMGMGEHIDTSGQGNSSGNNGPNVEGPDDPKDRDSMDDQTSWWRNETNASIINAKTSNESMNEGSQQYE